MSVGAKPGVRSGASSGGGAAGASGNPSGTPAGRPVVRAPAGTRLHHFTTLNSHSTQFTLTSRRLATGKGLDHRVVQMHVGLGHWIAENTPPDAILALNDIGAITYVSERQIVDLAGLVTPEVIPILRAPDRDERLVTFILEQDVDYAIVFPDWFPGLAARDDVLREVHRVTLSHNTIAGGETMVVYELRRANLLSTGSSNQPAKE